MVRRWPCVLFLFEVRSRLQAPRENRSERAARRLPPLGRAQCGHYRQLPEVNEDQATCGPIRQIDSGCAVTDRPLYPPMEIAKGRGARCCPKCGVLRAKFS